MRDIEFRAWDKPYKQMCNVSMLQFDYDGTICAAVIIEKPFNDQRLAKIDDLIIEQFTGLKDKNGKEIYEGDIVKVEGDGEIYRVKWIRSGFGLEPRYNSPRYPVLGNVELRKKIEVVSNIHENPELLEEK